MHRRMVAFLTSLYHMGKDQIIITALLNLVLVVGMKVLVETTPRTMVIGNRVRGMLVGITISHVTHSGGGIVVAHILVEMGPIRIMGGDVVIRIVGIMIGIIRGVLMGEMLLLCSLEEWGQGAL